MEKQIHDSELGDILIRTSPRATRYSLKISGGKITATMPVSGDEKRMLAFINENKDKLKQAIERHPPHPLLDDKTEMQTATFTLHIFRSERTNFYLTLDKGILHIACPTATHFEDRNVQTLLNGLLEKALRHEANQLLPSRLIELARQHKFTCTGVKINSSKTHWGSCTAKKSINLSLSLMLLPWHLIDYVLLHELCHTVEMNHSDRFWNLMNQVTGNKSLELRQELKSYHTIKMN